MKIIPIASESLGVRSLAVFVKVGKRGILIDPGAALGPKRYSLSPANSEMAALQLARSKIQEFAKKADVITISHYHYDHHTPFFEGIYESSSPEIAKELYSGKILLIKHPTQNINASQKRRAHEFLKNVEGIAKKIEYGDSKTFDFGDFKIEFSPPVPHGREGSKLGFVVMVLIDDGKKSVIHASDTQLINEKAVKWIIEKNPDLLIAGGPPTYLTHRVGNVRDIGRELINRIINETNAELIIDHHIVRDKGYEEFFNSLDKRPLTFAEFLGRENAPLEAYRKELHEFEKGKDVELPKGIVKFLKELGEQK
ncbi:hypothetical protein PFDSM3638_02975 [Pyrococcus furiosus DSM 3638]|uniref:UPF0282 protein PF0593 n=3 Tax=Pyrococcus furiosus TaxID=2261 RepID=Y593_PYRFU|nr:MULTISPECIES: MBL fold metallo-hydrolase [Pyrococcus]Q8U378.1 RecName: Full=UPF0282 protein PF0593 [Pyrococcus furiosus DSM 3638]AAL80717.1 hypothetical protein PF0593 [Pyrococcus furiosus DSM 3638]AFN03386.1 hypothetical protein PFC_02095 [Pyrococcus furiosus COM1]MDK2870231.1 uncharacterized protein [Pyrococcus sp.]QEK78299.1 hypothetical protein PFDSM3638_02975 [Pyrococcus furiosus DSM 3638]